MLSSLLARGTERLLDVWLESTNSSSLSADDVKKYVSSQIYAVPPIYLNFVFNFLGVLSRSQLVLTY